MALKNWVNLILLIFVPVSIALGLNHFNPIIVFVFIILAFFPITRIMARSTQQLSMRTSTLVGSLFNATFGNAIELMIAISALGAGLVELVKASITGSIILNILLLIGLSMLFGGIKYREQTFNKDSAGVASTMLLIAVAGLALPTIYSMLTGKPVVIMSYAVSITLGATYLFSLVFVLFTHKHLFEAKRDVSEEPIWGVRLALVMLIVSVLSFTVKVSC